MKTPEDTSPINKAVLHDIYLQNAASVVKVPILRFLGGAFFFLFTSHIFENKYEGIVY